MANPVIPAKLFSPKFYECLTTTKRYNIFWGGRGSTKSAFCAQFFVLRAMRKEYMKLIYSRKDHTQIRESQFSLLKKWIRAFNLLPFFTIYEGSMKIVCNLTGNTMIAKGLFDPEDTKGIDEPSHLWMEEMPEFDQTDFETLNNLLRTELTTPQMFGTFNPIDERNWVREFFFHPKFFHPSNYQPNPIFGDDILLHHSTFKDNPFIDREKYYQTLLISAMHDENKIKVNANGEWGVENKENKFCWAFNRSQIKATELDHERIVWATFDFNVNPMTCTVAQIIPEEQTLRAIECIKLENSDIWVMCERLNASYEGIIWMVTGDATGKNHSAMIRDNMNFYKIIMQQMHISDERIKLPGKNPPIEENRLLVNMVHKQWNIEIDPERCKPLIYDLEYVEMTREGDIIKDRSTESKKSDFLDGWRYLINAGVKQYLNL